jgi:Holliday junction resolvase RusA-like endonuclease
VTDPITFTVPGRPIAKGRPRYAMTSSGPRVYTPRRTIAYETAVAWAAKASGLKLAAGAQIRVRVEASFAKGPWPDMDNVQKAICDGLQKAFPVWNDRDVVECSIIRCVGADEARVLVEVLE